MLNKEIIKYKRGKSGTRLSRPKIGNLNVIVFLVLIAAFMMLPFVYTVVQAFKPPEELFLWPPRFFVKRPTLGNFTNLVKLTGELSVPFSRYILNSVFLTVVVTAAGLFISSLAAFPLAKIKFPGSKIIFEIIVLALLFSSEVIRIPSFVILSKLSLINNYYGAIFPMLAVPLGLFLMKNFMSQISDAVLEAAQIDGAGILRSYWRIAMPMIKPAWLTFIILTFQSMWNYSGGVIYTESLKTLPTIATEITAFGGVARTGVSSAIVFLLLIPPIVLFVILQSNVVQTMSHSGIK